MARILVIDDDAFMRQMFADALAEAGHSVRLADDGPQGLLLLDEAPPRTW